MILHNIPDDAELVKVTSPPLSAKALLHDHLDVVNVLPAPHRCHEVVAEAHDQHVLQQHGTGTVSTVSLLAEDSCHVVIANNHSGTSHFFLTGHGAQCHLP
jgi:hypothetical protein